MKKGVIAISVILLVAAGAVMPAGYFGQVAERTLRSGIENMPPGLQMELAEYRRGWFSSTARLEWRPPGNVVLPTTPVPGPFGSAAAAELSNIFRAFDFGPIAIDLKIAHGPVFFAVGPGVGLFNARGRIDLGGEAMEAAAESDRSGSNFVGVHLSSFSGRTVSNRVEFRQLNWHFGPVFMILTGGRMAGEWTGPNAFQLHHAVLEKVEMHSGMVGEGVRFSMTDIESRIDYPQGTESAAVLSPSESISSIGEVLIADSRGNTMMRMTGLSSLDSVSENADGLYRVASRSELESLDIMGREFASIEWNQDIGNFSETAILNWITLLSAGLSGTPPDPQLLEPPPPSPPPPPNEPLAGLLPPLPAATKQAIRDLLADAPYADISASAMYQSEHAIRLDSYQAFNPDQVPAGVDLASLTALLSALDYKLDLEIPKQLAENLLGQAPLRMALSQRLLEQNDTAYTLNMAFQNGTLQLNGRTLPLPLSQD